MKQNYVTVTLCMPLTTVSACPRAYLWNYVSDLHRIFLHIIHMLPMAVARSCDTLCISDFTDDVIFAHNGP